MIGANEFLFRGGRAGVLLIHGLTGTPSEMRQVGRGLHRAGFSVYGMQLAGHCGSEADLLATGWRDWYASVCAAAERFAAELDHLFVGGLSMGALLALHYAADHPRRVAGLGLYGTTLRYDGWAVPPIARLSFLLPLLTALGIGRQRRSMETFPYGIRDERIRARIAGAMLAGDSAAAGLAGNPWPSLAQFQRLSWRVRRRLHRVRLELQLLITLRASCPCRGSRGARRRGDRACRRGSAGSRARAGASPSARRPRLH